MKKNIAGVIEDRCCGCGACFQICPKKSILMKKNMRGFYVPTVDEQTCIDCGLCKNVCPEIEKNQYNSVIGSYAAITKDKDAIDRSTSGGVFSEIAKYIIMHSGVVYGCSWNDNKSVHHRMVEKIQDLKYIQQSKYVQSNTERTFEEVKRYLLNDKVVLYSGTGCQIAGLKKYLKKDYDKLITVEVACHGVPSPGLFEEYIKWMERKNNQTVNQYTFRNKKKHKKGEHYKLCVNFKNGKEKYYLSYNDPYYGAFLQGKTLRKTCYHCKYKESDRIADILLSDYWGIEKEHPQFPAKHGASAVVICSTKGEKLFNNIKDKIIIEESTFDKIVAHNRSIISCAKKTGQEYTDLENVDELMKTLKPKFSAKRTIKNIIPENLKYFLKRI